MVYRWSSRTWSRWTGSPGPLRYAEIVSRRLAGLDPVAREVVNAAAVLGNEVDAQLLGTVTGRDRRRTLRPPGVGGSPECALGLYFAPHARLAVHGGAVVALSRAVGR